MIKIHRRNGSSHLRGESGQAALEYILILVITVMIIMSVVWQFNTAFKKYANDFFDGYIACLLETGELVGNGICEAEYKAFKVSNGTTLTSGGGGGSGSGGSTGTGNAEGGSGSGGSGGSSGSTGKDSKTPNTAGNSGESSGSGSGASEVGASSSGNGGSAFGARGNRNRQRSTTVGNIKGQGDLKGREPLTAVGSSADFGSRDSSGRRRKVALDRGYGFSEQEENDKALTAASAPVAKDEDANRLKPKKVSVDLNRAPATTTDDEGSGFSIGNFIRILLIAGIIIAIVILFGGQMLQISKNSEK